MKICIEKKDDGTFSVGVENESPEMEGEGGMKAGGMKAENEYSGMQPARSLQEALPLAGRFLSAPQPGAGPSPFDEGMQRTMPNRQM